MEFKRTRALKEFDSLYKMIDDIYHEIALSIHLTDSAFIILYCLLELGDGCSQKDICKLYSISKQTINSSVKSLESKGFLIRRSGSGRDIHLYFTEFGKKFANEHIGPVLIWKMQLLPVWNLLNVNSYFLLHVNMFRSYRNTQTNIYQRKRKDSYHEDSVIRSFYLQTSDPFCISIDHYDDLYFDVQYH